MDEELDQLFEMLVAHETQLVEEEEQVSGAPLMVTPLGVEHAGLHGMTWRQKGQHVPEELVGQVTKVILPAHRGLLGHSVEQVMGAP